MEKTYTNTMRDSIRFLDHHITVDGVAPDLGKVRAISEMPVPADVEAVRGLRRCQNTDQGHMRKSEGLNETLWHNESEGQRASLSEHSIFGVRKRLQYDFC